MILILMSDVWARNILPENIPKCCDFLFILKTIETK